MWWDRDCGGFLGGEAAYFSSSLVSLGRAVKRAISWDIKRIVSLAQSRVSHTCHSHVTSVSV